MSATLLAAAGCSASLDAQAQAERFPAGAIHMIAPFSPGAATDILGRVIAEDIGRSLGTTVVIDNRPGAGGTIGAAALARARPDGLTIALVSASHVISKALFPQITYDPIKDFAAIGPVASLPGVLIVSPDSPDDTVQALVAEMRAHPDAVNYGSAGVGSAVYLNAKSFLAASRTRATHVPFKGPAEVITEIQARRIQFAWSPLVSSIGPIKSGKLKALAVSSPQRAAQLPAVPTISEAGYPKAEFNFWLGMLAPAGAPAPVVQRLAAAIGQALVQPNVKERLASMGAQPMQMAPDQFTAFMRAQAALLGELVEPDSDTATR